MNKFEPSLDIALSTEPFDAGDIEIPVVPLTSTESLVATRGLAKHLDILYKGVAKKASKDRALLQVFNFLSKDMDAFRRRSMDIALVLNPDGPELDPSRVSAAMALAALIRGKRSHQTGVWLKGKAANRQASAMVTELLDVNRLDFFEMAKQGHREAQKNNDYWEIELQKLRSNPYIERLREAIDESDHYLFEV